MKSTNINDWHTVCITDKTGQQHFRCTASPMSTMSEINNLKRHLDQAKKNPTQYHFLDVDTAVILVDGNVYGEPVSDLDADALLKELGL